MNLQSKKPNARYDMEHGRPLAIEYDQDGSCLFRWCIEPEADDSDAQIGWRCHEIRIWSKPTFANLKRNVIRYYLDECDEFSIVNGYNKHILGIVADDSAVTDYISFLTFTEEVSTIIKAAIG